MRVDTHTQISDIRKCTYVLGCHVNCIISYWYRAHIFFFQNLKSVIEYINMGTLKSSIQFLKQFLKLHPMIKFSADNNGVGCANWNGSLNVREFKKKDIHVGMPEDHGWLNKGTKKAARAHLLIQCWGFGFRISIKCVLQPCLPSILYFSRQFWIPLHYLQASLLILASLQIPGDNSMDGVLTAEAGNAH